MEIEITQSRELAKRIENSKGIISVSFKKADGSVRKINGRIGVTKHLAGGKRTTDPDKYIVIFELNGNGYRCVNKDTILGVTGC